MSAAAATRVTTGSGISFAAIVSKFAATIVLVALIAYFSATEPGFRTSTNIFNIMRQVSFVGIMAIGMTFVILTAGIDLSVGSLLALAGIVGASAAKGSRSMLGGSTPDAGGVHVLYALLAALGVGLAFGFLHGVLIGKVRIPAFIVTLGGLGAYRGATQLWAGGQPISNFSRDFRHWGVGLVDIAGRQVPIPVIFFVGLVILAHVVLRYTRYGRWIYALGGNAEAARLSGLNTVWLIISVYVIAGLCAGFSAFLLSARLGTAEVVAGQNYELQAIASVVIGGTSLFGGEGGVLGTFVGAMLIGVLNNGLVITGVSPFYQPIAVGVIIVLSVFIDQLVKRGRR